MPWDEADVEKAVRISRSDRDVMAEATL
jgi:hypothetical protein